jgi:acyl carrier protein
MDVEDHFGILLREDDSQRIRTIGDLADVILARIFASAVTPCPSMRAFYELRKAIRESLGSNDLRMRPSTQLAELIPLSHRRECWAAIQSKQPWRFPGLRMNRLTYNFTLAFVALVYVIPFCFLPLEMWVISVPCSSLVSIVVYTWMKRYRSEIPQTFTTVGDLVKSSIGSVIATKKTELTTKELVLGDLLPIVAEQFGVDIKKLTSQTRFVEDLGAG